MILFSQSRDFCGAATEHKELNDMVLISNFTHRIKLIVNELILQCELKA